MNDHRHLGGYIYEELIVLHEMVARDQDMKVLTFMLQMAILWLEEGKIRAIREPD